MKEFTEKSVKMLQDKAQFVASKSAWKTSKVLWEDGLLAFLENMREQGITIDQEIDYLSQDIQDSANRYRSTL